MIMENTNKTREIDVLVGLKDFLIELNAPEDYLNYVDKKIEQNRNKAEARKSLNEEKSKVTEDIKALIIEALKDAENEKGYTINELLDFDNIKEYTYKETESGEVKTKNITNQKLTYAMTKLKEENIVERNVEKKKAYYKLVKVED